MQPGVDPLATVHDDGDEILSSRAHFGYLL